MECGERSVATGKVGGRCDEAGRKVKGGEESRETALEVIDIGRKAFRC